jgi:hypothetical protein
MNWRRFPTFDLAQEYCDQQTALMRLPDGDVTDRWAIPQELTDGSFVVPAYQDATAIAWDASWVLMPLI